MTALDWTAYTTALYTERLELTCMTLPMVEAVLEGDRARAETLAGAKLPDAWPGRSLVERAFGSPLERLRRDPESALWGARLMIPRSGERMVIGSVVLNGRPDAQGTVEIGYGVESGSQGKGYATEASRAVLHWALTQATVQRVTATTTPWHKASLGVIRRLDMRLAGSLDHPLLGELLVFERTRSERASFADVHV
jgi:RimJ/RimL family protein N-acetyltransferase